MKTKFYLLFIFLCFLKFSLFSQNAYYDAKKLSEFVISGRHNEMIFESDSKVNSILLKYSGIKKDTTIAEIAKKYKNNHFITDYFSGELTASEGKAKFDIGSVLGVASGVDITKYVSATSDFLVERVKAELTLAFFDKFKNQLNSTEELRHLFPCTYTLLENNDMFMIPSMGQTWKISFETDLQNTLENFETMVNSLDKYKELRESQEFTMFLIGIHSLDMLSKRFSPRDILNYLDSKYGNDTVDINQQIKLLNLISENISDTSDSRTWITFNDFKKLDKNGRKIFIGLLYQQDTLLFQNIKVIKVDTSSLKVILEKNIDAFNNYLQNGLLLFNNLDQRISEIKNTQLGNLKPSEKRKLITAEFIESMNLLTEIIDFGFSLKYFSTPYEFYERDYYKDYRPVIVNSTKTINAAYKNNYGLALVYSIKVIEPLIGIQIKELEEKINNSIEKDSTKEGSIKKDSIEKHIKNYEKLQALIKQMSYYGNFMVDIINADSTTRIKEIINKYAQPVGSYKIKRKSLFSAGLNAYPGLFGAFETDFKTSKSHAWVTGVTAPIGFSFNWGFRKTVNLNDKNCVKVKMKKCGENTGNMVYKSLHGSSTSIFLSIVDIGAPFTYSWNNSNDTLNGFPEAITLEQIFAPGLYFVYGIKNAPLSIKIGGQLAPLLGKIENENNVIRDINAWRFGITLTVDIPVLNFYYRKNKF